MTDLLPFRLLPIHNPYWDEVREHVEPGDFPWESPCVARMFRIKRGANAWDKNGFEVIDYDKVLDRHDYVGRFAWSITDPWSVHFVAAYSRGAMVDPMAGTGYWAYVLGQLGVDVACYDSSPPPEDNKWHGGCALWVPVAQGYAECIVDKHPDRVLFLAWPPYSESSAARTLREYRGDRVIYIGEGDSGCTGDDDFHDLLDSEWHVVAWHTPIQWWGVHDEITVYERGVRDRDEDDGWTTTSPAVCASS